MVVSEAHASLGLTANVDDFTCREPGYYSSTWATGQGVGQGASCIRLMDCPAPLPNHYTTVALTQHLDVRVGDVLYFMFRFDTEAFASPMAFQAHLTTDDFYPRAAQNLDDAVYLAFETLVAACD